MKRIHSLAGLLSFVLAFTASASADIVIYSDDFSGNSGSPLSGTAPDIRPGSEVWTSNARLQADGTLTGSGTFSAFLPFVPVAGNIYTLSVEANPVTGNTDWLAVGFTASNSTGVWNSSPNNPVAWIHHRADRASASASETFLGTNTNGPGAAINPNPDTSGFVNLKVVLNTTPTLWNVEWFLNGTSVRTASFAANPSIAYIGLAGNNAVTGAFDNLSLTAVPEPSSLALVGCGLVALPWLWRRYRRAA